MVSPGDMGRMAVDGTFTANGASLVTITNPKITPNSMFDFTVKTPGGTVGSIPTVKTITNGSVQVAATASDTSVYNYKITG